SLRSVKFHRDDVQVHIQADEDLAQRMLEEERDNLSIEERSRLLTEFIDQRKNMLAAKRMLFDRTIETIRKFIPIESEGQIADSKAGEESSKEGKSLKRPAKEELGQEQQQQKKQKVKEDLSQERLQQMMVIILEQGVHVKALQTKYPIIDWEIYTEGTRQ
nr:hypothetical protein [Tanacetum cinerariifolium]